MVLKHMACKKIFTKTGVCLILMIIVKIRGFMILLIKKVINKMKDEVKGNIIDEFVGLISKIYFLVTLDNKEIKKAKSKLFFFSLFLLVHIYNDTKIVSVIIVT